MYGRRAAGQILDPREGSLLRQFMDSISRSRRLRRHGCRTAMSNSENFQVHERLGQLATGSDYWWELKRGWFFSESREVERIASDLRQKWLSFGKPWVESISDLRSARRYLLATGWGQGVAISMSLALGEADEAREVVIDSLRSSYRPPDDVLSQYWERQLLSLAEVTTLRRLLMQRDDVLQSGLEELFGRSHPRLKPTGH